MPHEAAPKNFEGMDYGALERDPVFGPVLQEMALVYLKAVDTEYFDREYTGERDDAGYLKRKDGAAANTLPSQNVTSGMKVVEEMTKQKLRLKG